MRIVLGTVVLRRLTHLDYFLWECYIPDPQFPLMLEIDNNEDDDDDKFLVRLL